MSRNSSSEISNAQLSGKKVGYGYFFFFLNGWNKGRDKKFCITSDRISGFPVSAVLCDIPQLSRHNRSKREITAESILELDWWFLRG